MEANYNSIIPSVAQLMARLDALESENRALSIKLGKNKGKPGRVPTVRMDVEEFIQHALAHNPPNADTALRIFARYLVSKGKDESKESWQSRVEAQVVAWKAEYAVVVEAK